MTTAPISPRRLRQLAELHALAKERGFTMAHRNAGTLIGLCACQWEAKNACYAGPYSRAKDILEMFPPVIKSLAVFTLP